MFSLFFPLSFANFIFALSFYAYSRKSSTGFPCGTNLLPTSYRMHFFIGFRLASYRGVGVGCEAPSLRSFYHNFLDNFCTLLISMHLHIHPFKVGILCQGIHGIPFPLYCRGGMFLMKGAKRIHLHNPHAFRTL